MVEPDPTSPADFAAPNPVSVEEEDEDVATIDQFSIHAKRLAPQIPPQQPVPSVKSAPDDSPSPSDAKPRVAIEQQAETSLSPIAPPPTETVTVQTVPTDTIPSAITPRHVQQQSEDSIDEWIDRTNEPLGKIGNGYTLTPTLQSLVLTNNRLKKIERLESCTSLTELVLRQNAITEIEGLSTLINLTELDLYMNAIAQVPSTAFQKNPKLVKLDLTFNQLRSLDGFPSQNLGNLRELYLIGNKIRTISGLHSMPRLTMLELGDNRVREIENLDALTSLEGLWLGKNKITAIRNLDALVNLRKLSLQSNRITAIEGLGHLTRLTELYLSHNGLQSMRGVEELTNLELLDLGGNAIKHIEGVERLEHLTEFWFHDNQLESFEDLRLLCAAKGLETVYLEGNPIAQQAGYERTVLDILPSSLQQLDATLVVDVRRELERRGEVKDGGDEPKLGGGRVGDLASTHVKGVDDDAPTG